MNLIDKNDVFLRGSAVLFVGNMIGNVCNYLFQFFMARNLSVEDFGAMNSLLSLLMISSVPALSIMLVAAKYVSNFKATGELDKIRPLKNRMFKPIALFGGILFVVLLFISPLVRNFLKIDSVIPVIIVISTLYVSFLLPVFLGILQGLQAFMALGVTSGMLGIMKLLFGGSLVWAGFNLNGALGSLLLAVAFVLVISILFLKKLPKNSTINIDLEIGAKKIISYSIPVMLTALGIMALTNMDMVLVKHFFSEEEAGNYAKIAVLGKTIFYLPGIIVMALFPMVAESHARNQGSNAILLKALVATAFLSGSGTIVFWCFPDFMLKLLYGSTFDGAGRLLFWFSLLMFFMSFINIFANFNLAKESKTFLWSVFGICFLELILIILFHQQMLTVIFVLLGCSICLTALIGFSTKLKVAG